MTWLSEFQDAQAVRNRAARTLSVQIGLANPLWLAYGAAASAGAAWWLMAKSWRPVNLEAQAEAVLPAPAGIETPAETALEAAVEAAEPVVAAAETIADDLTRLTGVGPKTAAALAAKGVATFADLAAWSIDDLAAFDAELKLKGRSLRDGWLDQAKALAAG